MTNKLVIMTKNFTQQFLSTLSAPRDKDSSSSHQKFLFPFISSVVSRKYDENHFVISYLRDLLVSVYEMKTYQSLKFDPFYVYILVKRSHGDKWLHTLVSSTMVKRYWSGER